ncbi:TPA: hypothetical protein ACNEJR_004681 [Escherichia coli]
MADVLAKLPADGKLPDVLGDYPDQALAEAWCAQHGGKIPFYTLDKNGTAELVGYWTGSAGYRHPQTGQMVPSTVPPQFRAVDSLNSGELYEKLRAEAEAKRPYQPAPDWENDPIAGLQKSQTQIDQPAPKPSARPSAPADPYKQTVVAVPDLQGNPPHVSSRDPWSAAWVVSGGGLQTQSTSSADAAVNAWNELIASMKP